MTNEGFDLKQRLEIATERELYLAAEAVVEAAIWRYRIKSETLGGRINIPEQSRKSLVDLIYHEPNLTEHLFSDEIWEEH